MILNSWLLQGNYDKPDLLKELVDAFADAMPHPPFRFGEPFDNLPVFPMTVTEMPADWRTFSDRSPPPAPKAAAGAAIATSPPSLAGASPATIGTANGEEHENFDDNATEAAAAPRLPLHLGAAKPAAPDAPAERSSHDDSNDEGRATHQTDFDAIDEGEQIQFFFEAKWRTGTFLLKKRAGYTVTSSTTGKVVVQKKQIKLGERRVAQFMERIELKNSEDLSAFEKSAAEKVLVNAFGEQNKALVRSNLASRGLEKFTNARQASGGHACVDLFDVSQLSSVVLGGSTKDTNNAKLLTRESMSGSPLDKSLTERVTAIVKHGEAVVGCPVDHSPY